MPLHDWTRVDDGIFHAFHLQWIAEIAKALNNGLLPEGFYALGEQVADGATPDVLALHLPSVAPTRGTVTLSAPRRTKLVAEATNETYTRRQRRLALRHVSGHRLVALIEIVSAGNKSSRNAWRTFVDKSLAALRQGVHLLLLDVHPPTPRDPGGIHGGIWGELTGETYQHPPDADRTLAAYEAAEIKRAYVEPISVGQVLPEMPLFLSEEGCIEVPLEPTYRAAFDALPRYYRDILERAT